jgi:hypothetical protein
LRPQEARVVGGVGDVYFHASSLGRRNENRKEGGVRMEGPV